MATITLKEIAQIIRHPEITDSFIYSNAHEDKYSKEDREEVLQNSHNSNPSVDSNLVTTDESQLTNGADIDKNQFQACEFFNYKAEQKTVLERLSSEVSHAINFGIDSYGELRLPRYVCGMEEGNPAEHENVMQFDYENLDIVYTDDDVRNMVGHLKRLIRLPIGPTAANHICDRMTMLNLGETKLNPRGETVWEYWVYLSNASMSTDPLHLLSVSAAASKHFIKDLSAFRNKFVDSCENLRSKLSEELVMHFNNGHYSVALGKNRKEIINCGNYERSFLCDISGNFDKTLNKLSNLPGVLMVSELSEYEKTELANICDVKRTCRVEFDSFNSYDFALYNYAAKFKLTKLRMKNSVLLPTTRKQLCLHLKWYIWPSKRQALIELEKGDIMRCKYVLEEHDFLAYDITSRCHQEDSFGKIVIKAKTSALFDRMWHDENDLKNTIHSVLHANNIQYRQVSLLRKRQQDIKRDAIIAEVNSRIIRSAFNCTGNIWSRQTVPTLKLIDEISANTSILPWDIVLKENDATDTEAVVEVIFHDEIFGRCIVDYMMPLSPDTGFFSLYKYDRIGVRIFPFYRMFIPVPRSVVAACVSDLSACDLYYGDAEAEQNSLSVDRYRTRNAFAKIISENSVDGLTVELWPERIIPGAQSSLQTILEGRTVDCSCDPYSMLLFGRGLKWLLSLAKHCEPYVVLTINRLRNHLALYGSAKNLAAFIETLDFFCMKTDKYLITERISLGLPRFLPCMPMVVSKVIGKKKMSAIFGEITFSGLDLSIVFRGSLKKLNELHVFLDDLNEKIFVNARPSLRLLWSEVPRFPEYSASRPTCPVCLCHVRISAYILDACGHYYCLECLCKQINYQTQAREFPWRCLKPYCGEEILMSDIKELMCLGGKTPFWFTQQDMYHWLYPLRDWVVRDPSSGYFGCDTPNCEGLFKKIVGAYISLEDDRKIDQPSAICTDCGVTRCLNCSQFAHDGFTCCESAKVKDDVDASIAHFKERNTNARNCPNINCGAVILKDDGCNHVFCTYCKTNFCWTCFASFDSSQSVYAHMHSVHGGFGGGWVILDNVVVRRPIDANF